MTSTAPKAAAPWINRYGIVRDAMMRTTRDGVPYITGFLESVNATGKTFRTAFTSFSAQVVAAVKAIGNGKFISLRGVPAERPVQGGKFSEPYFKALLVNTTRPKTA